jgi:hypothetical protein
MPVIPRTPLSPNRKLLATTQKENVPFRDLYDLFVDYYFGSDPEVRPLILERIINFVGHPAYAHLLRTMTTANAYHVIGYLRSQQNIELYMILVEITRAASSPTVPPREGF